MEFTGFQKTFLKISLHRMKDLYFLKLRAVLEDLPNEVLWTESYPGGNSIGSIVLHMAEHIARNCLRLTNAEGQLLPGFENFFPKDAASSLQLIQKFEEQLREWEEVMERFLHGECRLSEEHLHQIYHLVEHTGYHLGQIIDRVQGATGRKFHFCENGLNEAFLRGQIDQNLL